MQGHNVISPCFLKETRSLNLSFGRLRVEDVLSLAAFQVFVRYFQLTVPGHFFSASLGFTESSAANLF